MSPREARWFVLVVAGLGLTVCAPVILLAYPLLAIRGLSGLLRVFWVEDNGLIEALHDQRKVRDASLWVLCLGLVVTIHGLVIGAETSFTSPPSPEEKRLGRLIAYCGGGLALLSAVSAYLSDRGGSPPDKKPGPFGLDDLPP
jgi:hypothetical protein